MNYGKIAFSFAIITVIMIIIIIISLLYYGSIFITFFSQYTHQHPRRIRYTYYEKKGVTYNTLQMTEISNFFFIIRYAQNALRAMLATAIQNIVVL